MYLSVATRSSRAVSLTLLSCSFVTADATAHRSPAARRDLGPKLTLNLSSGSASPNGTGLVPWLSCWPSAHSMAASKKSDRCNSDSSDMHASAAPRASRRLGIGSSASTASTIIAATKLLMSSVARYGSRRHRRAGWCRCVGHRVLVPAARWLAQAGVLPVPGPARQHILLLPSRCRL